MNTLSRDEYELLRYDLLRLHHELTNTESKIDNDRIISRIHNIRYEISALLDDLKVHNIVR